MRISRSPPRRAGCVRLAVLFALSLSVNCRASAAADPLARRSGAIDEAYPGIEVTYDSVIDAHQHRLRIVVAHPTSATKPLRTVFLVGWLSCVSTEAPPAARSALATLFHTLAQAQGLAFVRVDKPGVGDSEGDCAQTDFETELSGYRAAFAHLAAYPFIDANQVYILGLSNGGGFAPLVATGPAVKGYVIEGAWVKTWYEHMVEAERRRLALLQKTPGEINRQMQAEADFYADYLIKGVAPSALFAAKPEWKQFWDDADYAHQYGRPTQFYQQLEKLNLADAWSKISSPVLALHGDFDWIMSRDDNQIIVDSVNRNRAGAARLVDLANTGHGLDTYHNMNEAFEDAGGPLDPALADRIVSWVNAQR